MDEMESDCIPTRMLSSVLASILSRAGATPAMTKRAMGELAETQYLAGAVIGVSTTANGTTAYLSNGSASVLGGAVFSSPPNPPQFADEFKRAQNEDRWVSVLCHVNAKQEKVIDFLDVYAAWADSKSSKRKP